MLRDEGGENRRQLEEWGDVVFRVHVCQSFANLDWCLNFQYNPEPTLNSGGLLWYFINSLPSPSPQFNITSWHNVMAQIPWQDISVLLFYPIQHTIYFSSLILFIGKKTFLISLSLVPFPSYSEKSWLPYFFSDHFLIPWVARAES